MKINLNFPDGITEADFLRDYWQKKPLYFPAALNNFIDPLEPEELAGLACEDEIAARIILNSESNDWQVRHNPFSEQDFTHLPATHWTVLVQDLNKHIHELDQLLDAFSFLPAWRIDDVMVSYAAPHGGVGPHTDQYDVFLIQGMGQRHWQVSSSKEDEALIEGIDVCILKEFNAEQEFLLETGDMLYLPPGEQHYGVSATPCMTYSIGLRAPTQVELLGDYIDHLTLEQTNDVEVRYRDPVLNDSPTGEITTDAINKIIALVKDIPLDEEKIKHWFGKFITSTHQTLTAIPTTTQLDKTAFKQRLLQGELLYRNPTSRFAFIEAKNTTHIYIDSSSIELKGATAGLAKHLCNHRQFNTNDLADWLENTESLELLCAWHEIGLLEFIDDDLENAN